MTDKGKNFKMFLPNIVTVLALCSGLTAMRFGLEEKWDFAVFAVMFAGILDFMDGRLARLLNASSRFGEELDSLSDLICFGVVPPFIVYRFALTTAPRFGWICVLFFSVCMALRLARFNVAISDVQPIWQKRFSIGVPAPAGALFILTPIMLFLATDIGFFSSQALNFGLIVVVGALLISHIPVFTLKALYIPKSKLYFYALLFIGLAALSYSHPFFVLSFISICLFVSIFFSYKNFQKLRESE